MWRITKLIYPRVRGGIVPVSVTHTIVEVDIEPTIETIVGVTADKREAAPQIPVFVLFFFTQD